MFWWKPELALVEGRQSIKMHRKGKEGWLGGLIKYGHILRIMGFRCFRAIGRRCKRAGGEEIGH